jgi:hypothetical protein
MLAKLPARMHLAVVIAQISASNAMRAGDDLFDLLRRRTDTSVSQSNNTTPHHHNAPPRRTHDGRARLQSHQHVCILLSQYRKSVPLKRCELETTYSTRYTARPHKATRDSPRPSEHQNARASSKRLQRRALGPQEDMQRIVHSAMV